jgi:hypothetical protein
MNGRGRYSQKVREYAERYGVSPRAILNLRVKRLDLMTEDARLVLTNDAKRNWRPYLASAESSLAARRKQVCSQAKRRDSVERMMELAARARVA